MRCSETVEFDPERSGGVPQIELPFDAMRSDELTEDIRAFVAKYVWTFEELQVLIRAFRGGDIEIVRLAETLGFPLEQVRVAAVALCERGLLVSTGSAAFRFEGVSAELIAIVARLVAEYESSPVSMARMLSANALERVRTAARNAFLESSPQAKNEAKK